MKIKLIGIVAVLLFCLCCGTESSIPSITREAIDGNRTKFNFDWQDENIALIFYKVDATVAMDGLYYTEDIIIKSFEKLSTININDLESCEILKTRNGGQTTLQLFLNNVEITAAKTSIEFLGSELTSKAELKLDTPHPLIDVTYKDGEIKWPGNHFHYGVIPVYKNCTIDLAHVFSQGANKQFSIGPNGGGTKFNINNSKGEPERITIRK